MLMGQYQTCAPIGTPPADEVDITRVLKVGSNEVLALRQPIVRNAEPSAQLPAPRPLLVDARRTPASPSARQHDHPPEDT